jgi:hypothetical protein
MTKRFWGIPCWLWLAVAIVANVIGWIAMRRYGFSGSERVQDLALIDTLVAVVWYAILTYRLVQVTSEQAETDRRPFVVIQPQQAHVGFTYIVKNIGQGLAVNVVHFVETVPVRPPEELALTYIGALGRREERALPTPVVVRLTQERSNLGDRASHVIAAEYGDGYWIATINLIEKNGRFVHREIDFTPSAAFQQKVHKRPLREELQRRLVAEDAHDEQ